MYGVMVTAAQSTLECRMNSSADSPRGWLNAMEFLSVVPVEVYVSGWLV